jgi:signal transduction histidine kinase
MAKRITKKAEIIEEKELVIAIQDDVESLTKQLNWYKSLFEKASDAVFIVQPDSWNVLEANDFAAQLLETNRSEIIGTSIPQFRRIFKLLKKSNSPVVLSELSLDTPKGKIMLEVSAKFINFYNEDFIYAIARDVGEQHALTDKLVQADKLVLLGQITAGVTHEIRNPLAAINLNLQILKRNLVDDPTYQKYIDSSLQGVDRISRIIEVTLNFSRQSMPDVKPININSIIPTSLELVASVLKRKEIKVELKFEDNLPEVWIDNKQIQQVFINMITNAADAIKLKGKIGIKTYKENSEKFREQSYVVVSISDTGEGIPPEDLPKIFNPFFTRKAEGTGLGLPITQRIVYQHQGIIDVESVVGKGTTFYVKLPLPRK